MTIIFAWLMLIVFAADDSAWLRSWIPAHCCVTNNCCFRVTYRDVTPLHGDRWRINATGQELPRTGYSPDGEYWRCACDPIKGKWTVHERAFTRCLFTPLPST
jgi:hypothetical protein